MATATNAPAAEPAVLTKPEAARFLRISVTSLERYMKDGKVPFVKLGANVRFRRADLEQVISVGFSY